MGPRVEKERRCDFKGRPADIGREKRASEEFGSRELGLSVSAAAQGVAGCGVIGFDLHHTTCFLLQTHTHTCISTDSSQTQCEKNKATVRRCNILQPRRLCNMTSCVENLSFLCIYVHPLRAFLCFKDFRFD